MKTAEELIQNAYSAVRASEMSRAIAKLTLDHFLQERIDSIQKKLVNLDSIQSDIDAVVKASSSTEDV